MLAADVALDRLLARFDAYRIVAAGFRDPDGPLPSDLEVAVLASALRALGRPLAPETRRALRAIADREVRAAEHRAIFGHVVADGCPTYETEYGRRHLFGQAQELADIAGFFAAVGLRPGPASERPDHVACELEFLAVTALKEARAVARGDDELASRTSEMAGVFVRDHVGRWLPAFAALVERRAPGSGYAALAAEAAELVADQAVELGVQPERLGPADLRPIDEAPNGFAFECGPEGLEIEPPGAIPGPGADAAEARKGAV